MSNKDSILQKYGLIGLIIANLGASEEAIGKLSKFWLKLFMVLLACGLIYIIIMVMIVNGVEFY